LTVNVKSIKIPGGFPEAWLGALRVLVLASLLGLPLAAASFFDDGEKLFMQNKPLEASALLESAVKQDPQNEKAWLELGIAYQQLKRYDEAVAALRKGASVAVQYRHLFYYNLGNVYFTQGRNNFADDMYSQALAANDAFSPAYLNRANTRVNLQNFPDAVADYTRYLSLEPASPKRPSIEKVVAIINGKLAEAEQKKQAAEAAKQAEADRKQALLNDISSSLKAAADDTKSLSAGAENVQGYNEDFQLEQ
jgi:tetratricopeptide (TPR) repeat protein